MVGIYVFFNTEPVVEVKSWTEARTLFLEAVAQDLPVSVFDGAMGRSNNIVGVEVWRYYPKSDNVRSYD